MKRTIYLLCALFLIVFSAGDLFSAGAGNALRFNGVNNYVTAGNPDIVASGTGNNGLTISAWIKAEDFVSDMGRIISKSTGVAEQDHYWMLSTFNSGGIKLRFRLKTSIGGTKTLIASSGNLVPGTWIHVAAVYDGNYMIIYKDGVEVGRAPKTGVISTNNGVGAMIGNNAPSDISRPFHGIIEDLRVLNVGLNATQLRLEMHRTRTGLESDVVAYWQMNEGTGGLAQDASGNGHTASLFGTSWVSSTAPIGQGTSSTQSVGATGHIGFAGTNLQMTFLMKKGTDQFVVSRIANRPEGMQPTGLTSVFPAYWVVSRFGTGLHSSSMQFELGPNAISPDDAQNPSNLKLLWREFNSDGPWTEVASGFDATTSMALFEGITATGQFAIGTIGDSPLPIQLASFTGTIIGSSTVQLDWRTVSELNNFGFFVERKASDNQEYAEIPGSFVAGNGTTIQPHDYSFTDINVPVGTYQYRLRQVDLDGTIHHTDPIQVTIETLTGVADKQVPEQFELGQNYPNPFNPSTRIQFSVELSGQTSLKVFDMVGREIGEIFAGYAEAGRMYEVNFDASSLTNGVYIYTLTGADNRTAIRKMTLLK